MHPVYKVSLELYVWAASATWENVFHFTLGADNGDGHRQPALWTQKSGERVKLLLTAHVSGNVGFYPKPIPIVDKDTWIPIEYGVVSQNQLELTFKAFTSNYLKPISRT